MSTMDREEMPPLPPYVHPDMSSFAYSNASTDYMGGYERGYERGFEAAQAQMRDYARAAMAHSCADKAELAVLLRLLADEFVKVFPVYYYAEPWAHDKNAALLAARDALSRHGG